MPKSVKIGGCAKAIASQTWDMFLRHSVVSFHVQFRILLNQH